jgi:glycosyltransferase involved in cell wall biosynthesis
MPRLLFIAYACPPRQSAGSIRAAGLAKYLPRLGWDVSILTAKLPNGQRPTVPIFETDYQDVIAQWKSRFGMDAQRGVHEQLGLSLPSKPNSNQLHTKAIECAKVSIAFPDGHKGWIPFAVDKLHELDNARQRPDIILSTSPPASGHLIARQAQQLFNKPWIADLRDLWTEGLLGVQRLLRPLHRRLERKTLGRADALVTVSSPWARKLQRNYPNKPVFAITNGFDPDEFAGRSRDLTSAFSITHTGYLYEGKRDPTLLFEVLQQLIANGKLARNDVRVRFYGQPESWLPPLVERYGLKESVEIGGVISRGEALKRQAESQLLLLLGWSDPKETGQHTGKLFEYFGSARPILAVGGAVGVLTETLNETSAGVHISEKDRLREYLITAYAEFKTRGFVSYHAKPEAIHRYTHMEMAQKFSDALTACLQENSERSWSSPLVCQERDFAGTTPRTLS